MSKGLWEPRTLPTNQPWPGGRRSGEAFSPEDWASTSRVRPMGGEGDERKNRPAGTEGQAQERRGTGRSICELEP